MEAERRQRRGNENVVPLIFTCKGEKDGTEMGNESEGLRLASERGGRKLVKATLGREEKSTDNGEKKKNGRKRRASTFAITLHRSGRQPGVPPCLQPPSGAVSQQDTR